jgi:uncharacterized protein
MMEKSAADEKGLLRQGVGQPWLVAGWQQLRQLSFATLVTAYLLALTIAELVITFVDPLLGLLLHTLILVLLLVQSARRWEQPDHRLLLALGLAPLIRIVSLSLPLLAFPFIYWFFITSLPLFAAAFVVMRLINISWRDTGLRPRRLPLQLAIGATGLLFGYVEYLILRPEPLIEALTWQHIWLPALILFISTGYMEELVFRRVMQRPAVSLLGRWRGVVYVAALFAIMHIGYQSLIDVIFVFVVGFFFGWAVLKTDSLVGVTISHGLTNIILFLVMPFLLVSPAPAPSPVGAAPVGLAAVASPMPTATAEPTNAPTIVPTNVPTAAVTPPATATPTAGASATATASPTPSASPTPLPPLTAGALFDNTQARLGPHLSYPVAGQLAPAVAYQVAGRSAAGDWFLLCCLGGETAVWVAADLLSLDGDGQTVPLLAPPPQAVVNVVRLNARAGPGSDYPVLAVVEMGEQFAIEARDATAAWWRVCCPAGESGWLFAESVTVWGDTGAIPVGNSEANSLSQIAVWLLLLLGGFGVAILLMVSPAHSG